MVLIDCRATVMMTVSVASLQSVATAALRTLNASWPPWVGNLANLAQIGGGLAAVVAFLFRRQLVVKPSYGSPHRSGALPGSSDECAASCLGSGGLPEEDPRHPLPASE
jgi:hypothetical protein